MLCLKTTAVIKCKDKEKQILEGFHHLLHLTRAVKPIIFHVRNVPEDPLLVRIYFLLYICTW